MSAPLVPGDGVIHDDERHVVLAIRAGHALLLHVDDGYSRTWLSLATVATWDRFDAESRLQARALTVRKNAADAQLEVDRLSLIAGKLEGLALVVRILRAPHPGGAS